MFRLVSHGNEIRLGNNADCHKRLRRMTTNTGTISFLINCFIIFNSVDFCVANRLFYLLNHTGAEASDIFLPLRSISVLLCRAGLCFLDEIFQRTNEVYSVLCIFTCCAIIWA